jgi:hypothetical protein
VRNAIIWVPHYHRRFDNDELEMCTNTWIAFGFGPLTCPLAPRSGSRLAKPYTVREKP